MVIIKKDIIGKKFGKLTVMNEYKKIPNGTMWKCKCECGNETFVYRGKLTTGHTRSCGCLRDTLDGKSNTKLYKVWWGIKERCYKDYSPNYKNYGERGIRMCDEWKDFETFYDWAINNGYSRELSIDRIDNDGDYCPENCRWIPLSENVARANEVNHRRKTEFTYYGIAPDKTYYEFKNANQFAEDHGLNANGLRRVARGERSHYKDWKFGYTNKENI